MKQKYAPLIGLLGYAAVSYFAVKYAVPFFLPFLLSVAVALLIESPVRWVQKQAKISRGLAVLAVLIAVVLLLGVAVGVGVARLVSELVRFSASLPAYYYQATLMFDDLVQRLSDITAALPIPVQNMLEQQVGRAYLAVEAIVRALLETLKSLPNLMGVLLISLLATFFVSRDRDMFFAAIRKLLPGVSDDKFVHARREVVSSTIGLLKAQLIMVIGTSAVVIIALRLMGSEYALALGLLIGVVDILPVIGPGLVFIPWAIYTALFDNLTRAILLLTLYTSITTVRQMVHPKLIGDQVGLHPLATLFAIYIGIRMFGPIGILLGPLLAIIFKALVGAGILPYWPGGGNVS